MRACEIMRAFRHSDLLVFRGRSGHPVWCARVIERREKSLEPWKVELSETRHSPVKFTVWVKSRQLVGWWRYYESSVKREYPT